MRVVVDSHYERFLPKASHPQVRIEHVTRIPGRRMTTSAAERGQSLHLGSMQAGAKSQYLLDFGYTPEILNRNFDLLDIYSAAINGPILSQSLLPCPARARSIARKTRPIFSPRSTARCAATTSEGGKRSAIANTGFDCASQRAMSAWIPAGVTVGAGSLIDTARSPVALPGNRHGPGDFEKLHATVRGAGHGLPRFPGRARASLAYARIGLYSKKVEPVRGRSAAETPRGTAAGTR